MNGRKLLEVLRNMPDIDLDKPIMAFGPTFHGKFEPRQVSQVTPIEMRTITGRRDALWIDTGMWMDLNWKEGEERIREDTSAAG
jgi:hypothetical protein